jgi:hypothetical protein
MMFKKTDALGGRGGGGTLVPLKTFVKSFGYKMQQNTITGSPFNLFTTPSTLFKRIFL